MALTVDACVAQHQGDRKEQQDRVALLQANHLRGTALAVVADGMGGHTGGALAAEQVVHTARTNLQQFSPQEEGGESLIRTSMTEAHAMIKSSRFMNEKDPHSTAVMLLLQPGRATWGYCGDSRLYCFRADGTAYHTTDHSYVEHLVAKGKITPAEALTHPHRNILLTSLGGKDEPKMDFGQTADLAGGDAFLLCSDGLWAYFSEDEMMDAIFGNTARHACEQLIAQARERADGEGDNVSIALIKLLELPDRRDDPVLGRRR